MDIESEGDEGNGLRSHSWSVWKLGRPCFPVPLVGGVILLVGSPALFSHKGSVNHDGQPNTRDYYVSYSSSNILNKCEGEHIFLNWMTSLDTFPISTEE